MPRPKKVALKDEVEEVVLEQEESKEESKEEVEEVSQKEHLLALYKELKDLNVRSISDLENLIAREG